LSTIDADAPSDATGAALMEDATADVVAAAAAAGAAGKGTGPVPIRCERIVINNWWCIIDPHPVNVAAILAIDS